MYVIGTAGHVDHGKSTLVQALTGIDPDRLREEKERGMTIDLGFAWLTLPGGTEVSVVDVPGHERFVKNMLAGVGGIDLALLVVAADEGVMPQTREHLAILDLLGVSAGVVAITKSDLVEPDWLELVEAEVAELLEGTTLAGSRLVPCSATSGDGLPQLLESIERALAAAAPKRDIGRPRLPIDRAFTIGGFGTVVTGTLIDGSLSLGQELVIEPGGLRTRIRGLQSHRQKVEAASPGTRAAVNVAGLATSELQRGMVLTRPGWLMPTTALDVRLRAVHGLPRPLKHNAQVTFHSGAAEVSAKVRLLDAAQLEPGAECWAQVRLVEPAAVVRGDGFVLRTPGDTVAGGTVVDTHPRRHRRNHAPTLAALAAMQRGTPEEALFELVARYEPVEIALVEREAGRSGAEVEATLARLCDEGRVVAIGREGNTRGRAYFSEPGFRRLSERAALAMRGFLVERPLRAGMPREELKSRLGIKPPIFNGVVALWCASGMLEEREALLAPAGYQVELPPRERKIAEAYLNRLRAIPFAPQVDERPDRELLGYLVESRSVVAVGDGIVFDAAAYERMVAMVTAYLREHGTITLAQTRDLFDTSRRFVQAFLEYLDERHVTQRLGDERVLRDAPSVTR